MVCSQSRERKRWESKRNEELFLKDIERILSDYEYILSDPDYIIDNWIYKRTSKNEVKYKVVLKLEGSLVQKYGYLFNEHEIKNMEQDEVNKKYIEFREDMMSKIIEYREKRRKIIYDNIKLVSR